MIYQVIDFIQKRLNEHLDVSNNGNIKCVKRHVADELVSADKSYDIALSLINIEEDRTFHNRKPPVRNNSGILYNQQKPILTNLYLLFTAKGDSSSDPYGEALKGISEVMLFFQQHRTFDLKGNDMFAGKLEKLVPELFSPNFEQINNLWGALGAKYIPSLIYKIKVLPMVEDFPSGASVPITEKQVNTEVI